MAGTASAVDRRAFLRTLLKPGSAATVARRLERVSNAEAFGDGVLWGMAGRGPEDLYAVGDDGLVLHYDGREWARQACDSTLPLHAIACTGPEEAVAVGWLGAIVRGEKEQWRIVQGGPKESRVASDDSNDRSDYPLFGVASDRKGRGWAGGDAGRIVEGAGDVWRDRDSGCKANLRAVECHPDGSVFVCGADGTILRGSDDQWECLESGTCSMLTGMAALESGDMIAVGGEYTARGTAFEGRLLHFDGRKWRVIETDFALPRLRGVATHDGSFVVAGDGGLSLRYDGTQLQQLESSTRHDLYAALTFGDRETTLCGGFGTIVQTVDAEMDADAESLDTATADAAREVATTGHWEVIEQNESSATLRGVWGTADEQLFAVGDEGTILHFDGGRWQRMTSPSSARLHAVWGNARDCVYAVGEGGVVLQFDGVSWRVAYQGSLSLTLVAVTGFDTGEVFCVGDGGLVLRFDGLAWERVETGTSAAFFAVWGMDARHVLAVGEAGAVLRFNGERWDPFSVGVEHALYSVWGGALDDVYVSGSSGALVHFDGGRWNREPGPARLDLFSIAGSQDAGVFAAGSSGTILRRGEHEWVPEPVDCEDSLRAIWLPDGGWAYAVGDTGRVVRRNI